MIPAIILIVVFPAAFEMNRNVNIFSYYYPNKFMVTVHRVFLLWLCLLLHSFTFTQSYKKLHSKAIVVDTHNDILEKSIPRNYSIDQDLRGKTHSDLNRFKEGGVDVEVFSVWCDGREPQPYALANRQIDTLYEVAGRNKDRMSIVTTPDELRRALSAKKLAAMIGVEGGHMMEDNLKKLDSLFNRGARYMTLTWNNSTSWATSALYENRDTGLLQPKGLNGFGKEIVKEMNRLGMMVDLSHVGKQTFYDALASTSKPVIVSHSCAYTLCPVPRNLKDEQIKALAKNGGVIHVNFYSGFLDSNYSKHKAALQQTHKAEGDSLKLLNNPGYAIDEWMAEKYPLEAEKLRAPLSLLIDHIDYMVKLAGIDHVGLGSDFDGIESPPQELNGVEDFPKVTRELIRRGYSRKDIKKILGGNFLRVFKANMQ